MERESSTEKLVISPSILSADFANLERDIKRVEKSGADWLHIDVMDGHFVENITIGVPVVKSIKKITDLKLDVHLMIENPEKYIEPFVRVGADIITFHYEATKERTQAVISKIKSYGIKCGLSIKPKTSPNEIKDYIPQADLILVMTVEPGFGGQEFIMDCAEKLKYIKQHQSEGQYLQVDGGINNITGKLCVENGANSLVAGNYIFNSDNIRERILSLKTFFIN